MEMLLALDVATTRWTLKTMFVARVERTCACGTRFCGNQLLRSDLRGCKGWTLLTCKLRSGLQASFVRLAFILVVTMLRGLKLRCIYGLLFSAISEDPLHIGNYKLAANYGCFRADQRIHFYNVCFSAACCGGTVHLWETAWLPGVIWLQGMEFAHVKISFVVDRGLFTSELRLLRLSCLLPLCCGTWESDRCIYGLLLQHMPAGTQHIGNHKLGANDGCSANS